MPNHFHFLAKQNNVNGLKMFLHRLCTSYSSYFNKKYKHVGHIFQGIYKSKVVLEDSYLIQLTGYIHLNPEKPFVWKYSSLPAYLGKVNDGLSNSKMFFEMCNLTYEKYKSFLEKDYSVQCLDAAQILFDED
jgi:putative transposase